MCQLPIRAAVPYSWILPRAKTVSTGHYFTLPSVGPLSSNPIHSIKKDTQMGVFFYGVDNGIRTHDLQSHNLTR